MTRDGLVQCLHRRVSATEDGRLHAASLTEILAQRKYMKMRRARMLQ